MFSSLIGESTTTIFIPSSFAFFKVGAIIFELTGLIIFAVILVGYGIWIAIIYLRKLFKSKRKK